jgi:translation initiation factor 2 subunit 3
LYKGKEKVKEVLPGASISIETTLDPTITKTDSLTGCLASNKGNLPEINYNLKLKYELFKELENANENQKIEKIKPKEMLMLSVDTIITVGTVEKVTDEEIELSLNIPVVALKESNTGIARNISGHWRLIGYGEVI